MAVVMTGSVNKENGSTAATQDISITIPADAEFLVMAFAGYRNPATPFTGGTLTYDYGGANTAMTEVSGGDTIPEAYQGMMAYVLVPSGDKGATKTVRHVWVGTLYNADLHVWFFYKGINTSTPVRDADGAQDATSVTNINLTSTTVSGDLVVAAVCGYVESEGSVTTWDAGISVDYEVACYDYSDITIGEGTATGVTLNVGPATVVAYTDGAVLAISLIPAAAGGALSILVSENIVF